MKGTGSLSAPLRPGRWHQFAFSWNHDEWDRSSGNEKLLQERLKEVYEALTEKLRHLPARHEHDTYPLTDPGHFGDNSKSNIRVATFTISGRDYQGFSVALDVLTKEILAQHDWRRNNSGSTRHRIVQRTVAPLLAQERTRRQEYEEAKTISTWMPIEDTMPTRRSKDTTLTHRFSCDDPNKAFDTTAALRRHLCAARSTALRGMAESLEMECFSDDIGGAEVECLAIHDASRLVLQWANREVSKFMTRGDYRKDWRPQRDNKDPRVTWWIRRSSGYKRELVKRNAIRPATAWTDKLGIGRRGRAAMRPEDFDTRSFSARSVSARRAGSSSSAGRPSGKPLGNAWLGNAVGWLASTILNRRERPDRYIDHSRSRSRNSSPQDPYWKKPGRQPDGAWV